MPSSKAIGARTKLTPERSLELADHSPSGFEWGYGGSGPAQLALALLLDYTDDKAFAPRSLPEFQNRGREPAGLRWVQ